MTRPLLVLLLSVTLPVWAQESNPSPTPSAEAVPTPSPIPDHVEATGALAEALAQVPQQEDPQRHLARCFVTVVHCMLKGELEPLLAHFHPALRFHTGGGRAEPMPPDQLRPLFEQQLSQRHDPGAQGVADVVNVVKIKVYSYARARAVDSAVEGWETHLGRVAKMMEPDDWLVIAPMKGGEWGDEVFFVFRLDPEDVHGRYKVVLSD